MSISRFRYDPGRREVQVLDRSKPELTALIEAGMARHRIPGVAVGVITPRGVLTATIGSASLERRTPVTADTLFEIASITKTATATLLLRLQDDGLVSLDQPIRRYLPDLVLADAEVAARVTLRDVLIHRAGWAGDDLTDFGCDDAALTRHVEAMRALPQVLPLGLAYAYNNSAFCLAGRVVEVVTGRRFEDAMRRLLVEIGLERPAFGHERFESGSAADGHFVTAGEQPVPARRAGCGRAHNANGGLLLSIADLLRYATFHLGDGSSGGARILRAGTIAAMHAPQATGPGDESVGWSWAVREVGGVRVSSHGGDGTGQQALLTIIRERGIAVLTLTNGGRGRMLAAGVERWALQRFADIVLPSPAPLARPGARLDRFAGRWVLPGKELVAWRDGNRLTIAYRSAARPGLNNPPVPDMSATITRAGRLVVLDGPLAGIEADLLPEVAGQPRRLRFAGRVYAQVGDDHDRT